jgi:hypothetical protein
MTGQLQIPEQPMSFLVNTPTLVLDHPPAIVLLSPSSFPM